MKVICKKCNKEFLVPEEKIPSGIKKFAVKCPSCKDKIVVEVKEEDLKSEKEISDFYTVPPDNFPPGSKTAFLYVFDEVWRREIINFLKEKNYYISEAHEENVGVQKLRINPYNVVFLEEKNVQPLLQEIGSWPGAQRRETNVILIGDRAESFDLLTAFVAGVNSYLSISDRDKIKELLEEAMDRYKSFIEMWEAAREILKEEGL